MDRPAPTRNIYRDWPDLIAFIDVTDIALYLGTKRPSEIADNTGVRIRTTKAKSAYFKVEASSCCNRK